MDVDDVVRHVLSRSRWTASRSSGPGGQRRDKVETRAELTVDLDSLEGLVPSIMGRLATHFGLEEKPLRMTSQVDRLLSRNQEVVAQRLRARIADALAPSPPPRRPTRPSRTKREARLAAKSRRGMLKENRRPPRTED
jgi:ribosome-associated protein